MKSKILFAAALGLLGASLAACGPDYDRTEITGQVYGPLGGEVKRERIVVPVGQVAKAHIVSMNDDNETMSNQITSKDTAIMEAIQVVSDRDYAFLGIAPGKTQIEIKADGETVLIIDAIVTEQPSPQ
jgi:hypothetical protein